jgi:hypothetical protein
MRENSSTSTLSSAPMPRTAPTPTPTPIPAPTVTPALAQATARAPVGGAVACIRTTVTLENHTCKGKTQKQMAAKAARCGVCKACANPQSKRPCLDPKGTIEALAPAPEAQENKRPPCGCLSFLFACFSMRHAV